jgi:hypothetical protein
MRLWAQYISLGLAAVGFVIALLPRNYTPEHTGTAPFRLLTYPKLLKFPIFWLGLALLGLVVVQALNPAWRFQSDSRGWWMVPIPHKEWLPVGVDVPSKYWTQWRMLIIYTSGFLTVCSVWIAFTRRRTVQYFLVVVALNGLLLAALGVIQRVLGNGKIFWFVDSPNPQFFASFIYKNHGSTYLDLALAATCGLASWYYLRGARRMEKSNPSGVLAFFATCIAVSVLLSYARGATLVMLIFLLLCVTGFVIHQFTTPSEHRRPIIAIVLVLIFGLFLKTGLDTRRTQEAWDRLKAGVTREDKSLEFREQVTQASIEMLRDEWKSGIGMGSYRYLFPTYQHRYPQLIKTADGPIFWEHAHNDIVQFPIELGAVGTGLLILGFGYWAVALLRHRFWATPLSASVVLGLLLVLGYAWWDFPFQCPAILITWCVLWAVAAMWARFEESGR